MTPSVNRSWSTDLPKKIISRQFQPMIEAYCRKTVMIQPRSPNCGRAEAMESMPKRVAAGTTASVTSSMPIMLPAVSAAKPMRRFR